MYAVTPRFAPTSSERQLELAGRLLDEHPGVYFQSHLAENRAEVAWVAELLMPDRHDCLRDDDAPADYSRREANRHDAPIFLDRSIDLG